MSFYGVTDLWTYVIGAFGIILLPGPNSLFVLTVATARGVKAGFQSALGVFLGDTVLLVLVALGAAGLGFLRASFSALVKKRRVLNPEFSSSLPWTHSKSTPSLYLSSSS